MTPGASRNAIKIWLRETMQRKGWSANHWATLAGTSPTNITRFLAPDCKIVPSSDTIAKLAAVAGTQPNLAYQPHVKVETLRSVQIMRWSEMKGDFETTKEVHAASVPVSDAAFALEVGDDSMNMAGIMPGDVLLVEPVDRPARARTVVVRYGKRVVVGEWQPPYVMPRSTNRDHVPVQTNEAVVIGVVKSVTRKLL